MLNIKNSKNNRQDNIIYQLVRSSIYYLLFGSFLNNFALIGGQYIYLVIVLIIVFLLSMNKGFNMVLFIYLCVVAFLIYYTYVMGLNDGYTFYASIVYYFAIPLVFGRNYLFYNKEFYKKTLYSILIIILPNAFVVLLQLQGLFLDIFPVEYTSILGVAQKRYGGIVGGSLINGLVSGLCVVVLFYRIINEKKHIIVNYFLLFSSLFTLLLSYSRGSYVFVILAVLFILYKNSVIGRVKSKYILFIIVIIVFLFNFADEMALQRLISVINFAEEGNALRLIYWQKTFALFVENILLGIGLGTVSTVGAHEYSVTNSGEAMIAESYYLKLMAEGGVFMMISFLFIVYLGVKKSISNNNEVIFQSIFIALNIESMILTSLEAPLISIIYWVVWSYIISENNEKCLDSMTHSKKRTTAMSIAN